LRTRAVRARQQGSYFLELLLADGETRQSSVADFARELLAVADNLQPALAAVGEDARRGEGSLIEGVEATRRLLTLAFERFRVRPIEALGKRFDPRLHEAVAMEESAEAPGTVVGVVEDGYTINGRLLRPPASVVQKPGRMPRPLDRAEPQGEMKVNEGRRDDRLSVHPQNAA
jgi:molecular chaperone GrpE